MRKESYSMRVKLKPRFDRALGWRGELDILKDDSIVDYGAIVFRPTAGRALYDLLGVSESPCLKHWEIADTDKSGDALSMVAMDCDKRGLPAEIRVPVVAVDYEGVAV